jgi:multidrug efflux pump subunit AcrB
MIPLIPKGFIPHLNRYEFEVSYVAPQDTDVATSAGYASILEDSLRRNPSVASTFTTIGTRGAPPAYGTIIVGLQRPHPGTSFDVENEVREAFPPVAGLQVSVEDIPFVETGATKPLQIAVAGDDLRLMRATAQKLKERLAMLPGFVNVTADGAQTLFGLTVQIDRFNSKRVAYVSADLGPGLDIGDATNVAERELRKILPKGLTVELGSNSADAAKVYRSFGIALLASVLCIFLVLFLLFGNWIAPLVIVISLPLAVVGAMFALLVTHSDFGLISLMGLIFLFGLVNKNAILLVDVMQRLRRAGWEREAAIVEAGSLRLRPIVMTTAATIFGMVPIALGIGAGAELRAPMAIAIIGGLLTSTLLTLVVIPVAYVAVEELLTRCKTKVA